VKRPIVVATIAFTVALGSFAYLRAHQLREPPPVLGVVPPFTLTDQLGQPFSPAALGAVPFVADFVFTSCAEICPRMTEEMARLQTYIVNRGLPTRLVSISVDPERDTPERLRDYATRFHARPERWHFLTGKTQEVQDAVVRGFQQTMSREKDPTAQDGFTILHGTRFVLVDGKLQIRGFYDPGDAQAMARLRSDLFALGER
jgi:protein SCO1/2